MRNRMSASFFERESIVCLLGTANAGHRRGYRPIARPPPASPSPHSLPGQPPPRPPRPIRVRACSLPLSVHPVPSVSSSPHPDRTQQQPHRTREDEQQATQAAAKRSLVDRFALSCLPPSLLLAFPEPVPPPFASPNSPPLRSPPDLAAGRLLPLALASPARPAVRLIKQIRAFCARTDCGWLFCVVDQTDQSILCKDCGWLLAASAKGSID